MAVRIKDLEALADEYTANRYVYKDLSLDLAKTKIEAPGLLLPTPGTDIKGSFDIEAISNSLTNLFNTDRGQRFLFPEYGLNLKRFLFTQVTIENGEAIGDLIYNGISTYEPRVKPLKVKVVAVPDQSLYKITAVIEIPIIKKTTDLNFIFDLRKESFISLPAKTT